MLYDVSKFFVLKEPRITRFISFYEEILNSLNVKVRYVLPIRNPLSVDASLEKRNQMRLESSLLLWLRYQLEAERTTRGRNRVFIVYEDLVRDWRSVLYRLCDELSITSLYPRGEATKEKDVLKIIEINNFLSSKYQHHSFTDKQLKLNPLVPEWVKKVYQAIKSYQKNPENNKQEKMMRVLDVVSKELDEMSHVFENLSLASLKNMKIHKSK